jgi:DNA-binding MarR family transcriptional regulator
MVLPGAGRRPSSPRSPNCTTSVPVRKTISAATFFFDAATIKGVVDRLAVRGFLTAAADPKDRRRRAVTLTDRGRAVTEKAMLVAAEITAATLAPLDEGERATVVRLLKKMG